ncbi:MAG: hypothetical protein LBU27_09515 [Candidatus Peribacteria bacterium]|nr:hypothetical protein [Candidatus Peribacteria bacterium]
MRKTDFFAYNYSADGEISDCFTRFEIDNGNDYQYMIKKLLTPPSKSSFQYEKGVVKKELEDCSYGQLMYESLLRKISNRYINLNTFESVTFEDVVYYHQQWYTKNNIIVCDDDFNLLFGGYVPKNFPKKTSVFFSFPFVYDNDSYFVF